MRDTSSAIVAQVLFFSETILNFPALVRMVETTIVCDSAEDPPQIHWDDEARVALEFGNTRLIVAIGNGEAGKMVPSLTLAISAISDKDGDPSLRDIHKAQLELFMTLMKAKLNVDTVLWLEAPGPVTTDLVEAMVEMLPNRLALLTGEAPPPLETTRPSICPLLPTPNAAPMHADLRTKNVEKTENRDVLATLAIPSNADISLRTADQIQLSDLRLHLHDVEDTGRAASTPMRVAVHTMNTTLMLVSLPIGASMMTYSILRGEDINLTARAMAITGTLVGLYNSHIHSHLASFI